MFSQESIGLAGLMRKISVWSDQSYLFYYTNIRLLCVQSDLNAIITLEIRNETWSFYRPQTQQ